MHEHDDDQGSPQDAIFADDLTIEGLTANAIWEQIMLARQRGDAEEGSIRIDPGFQRVFNDL